MINRIIKRANKNFLNKLNMGHNGSFMKNQDPEYLKQLKKEIGTESYNVCVNRGTERPHTGEYDQHFEKGDYNCKVCGVKLFESSQKFDAGCGWPAFAKSATKETIEYKVDDSLWMRRVETLCKKCGSHLGHVFDDGPAKMGGKRYCINSVCLKFEKKD